MYLLQLLGLTHMPAIIVTPDVFKSFVSASQQLASFDIKRSHGDSTKEQWTSMFTGLPIYTVGFQTTGPDPSPVYSFYVFPIRQFWYPKRPPAMPLFKGRLVPVPQHTGAKATAWRMERARATCWPAPYAIPIGAEEGRCGISGTGSGFEKKSQNLASPLTRFLGGMFFWRNFGRLTYDFILSNTISISYIIWKSNIYLI